MNEENKKTIISFIAGLLIGGLLVFIFSEPTMNVEVDNDEDREASTEVDDRDNNEDVEVTDEEEPAVEEDEESDIEPAPLTGGSVEVDDQAAGTTVVLESVNYPTGGGWVGVRDYRDGQMSGLLGVSRFNTTEGLLPSSVRLLRPTTAGNTYAVVFYSDNGDRQFNLAHDAQLSGVMETFEAE